MIDVHPDVAAMWDEGRDVGDIAGELGMSRYAVRRMVAQLDPPAARPAAPLIPPADKDSYLATPAARPEAVEARRQKSKDIVANLIQTTRARSERQ